MADPELVPKAIHEQDGLKVSKSPWGPAVKTRRGELKLPVWINGRARVPRGTLFIPFFDQRLLVNDITLGEVDPISKEPDYKKCAATVSKIGSADASRAKGLEKTL